MPIWEDYEVQVETKVIVLAHGKPISEFKTFGQARGGSNEGVNESSIPKTVIHAMKQAAESGARMSEMVRKTRRRELGYHDGD